MVDACAMHGIYPYYGPFGDIADVTACEDQFRNAFLLGCVGTWSLHPKQIEIANRVFAPSVDDITHARRVVAAMGDGTGAVMLDGKMEDDASLKQCLVMVELAEQLAAIDPQLKAQYDAIDEVAGMSDTTSVPAARSSTCRAPTPRRWRRPRPSPSTASSSTSRTPSPPTPSRRPARPPPPPSQSGAYGERELIIRVNGIGTEWHDADIAAAAAAGPDVVLVPKVNSAEEVHQLVAALEAAGAPEQDQPLGDGRDADRRCFNALSIAQASPTA